jgi:class 3 adenylate cyclase
MAFKDELTEEVRRIFRETWSTRKGQVVPEPSDLKMANDAIEFDRATVLYADLSGSTNLVDTKIWQFAGEVYKTFLMCSGRIIRAQGGTITAYDGDRIMAVFLGGSQTSSAAKCGLMINYAVSQIINPALKAQYSTANYSVKQVVGVDTSAIRAARTGVRGDNDIVWIGRAANYAAKLTELDMAERTWITEDAYKYLRAEVREGGSPKQNMWKRYTWKQQGGRLIYGSTWRWAV